MTAFTNAIKKNIREQEKYDNEWDDYVKKLEAKDLLRQKMADIRKEERVKTIEECKKVIEEQRGEPLSVIMFHLDAMKGTL